MSERPSLPPKSEKKLNPLLLFLIFPIVGIVAAVALINQHPAVVTVTPPEITYVPAVGLIDLPAPDFTLKTLTDQPVKLSSMRGQWVFINFWATWCQPCSAEMPDLQRLVHGDFGDYSKSVKLVAVDYAETPDTVKQWLNSNNVTLPVVLDPDSTAIGAYGVGQLPVTFIVDPNGIVRHKQLGEMTPNAIRAYLKEVSGSMDIEF